MGRDEAAGAASCGRGSCQPWAGRSQQEAAAVGGAVAANRGCELWAGLWRRGVASWHSPLSLNVGADCVLQQCGAMPCCVEATVPELKAASPEAAPRRCCPRPCVLTHAGAFHIGPFKVPAGADKAKLKVSAQLTRLPIRLPIRLPLRRAAHMPALARAPPSKHTRLHAEAWPAPTASGKCRQAPAPPLATQLGDPGHEPRTRPPPTQRHPRARFSPLRPILPCPPAPRRAAPRRSR